MFTVGQQVTWIGTSHLFERPVTIVGTSTSIDSGTTLYHIHDAQVIKGIVYSIPAKQLISQVTA